MRYIFITRGSEISAYQIVDETKNFFIFKEITEGAMTPYYGSIRKDSENFVVEMSLSVSRKQAC